MISQRQALREWKAQPKATRPETFDMVMTSLNCPDPNCEGVGFLDEGFEYTSVCGHCEKEFPALLATVESTCVVKFFSEDYA